jgi:hypothetical protein
MEGNVPNQSMEIKTTAAVFLVAKWAKKNMDHPTTVTSPLTQHTPF